MNAVFDPSIGEVRLSYHPSPDHNAHYDLDKYPFSNKLTMLRAILKERNNQKWFSHSPYTQQDPNCWWPQLPVSPTNKWTFGQITSKWFLITPVVNRCYERADDVIFKEEIQGWPGWGPTRNFEPGTRRYRVEVTYRGQTVSSPGGQKTQEGYIVASEARKALRMSVRDAQYANPIAQWATAWLGVPFIYGSLPTEVENFEGVDCADLLIAVHNKAHTWHSFEYTYADAIAKSDEMTEPGVEGTEGDLIFWDYHGPNEQGPPDGVYDHSMICLGGTKAIWASACWWSGWNYRVETMKRCVIIDDYERWRRYINSMPGWGPARPTWRRFK